MTIHNITKTTQLVLIILNLFSELTTNQLITVYTKSGWKGKHEDVEISQCTNFSTESAKKVNSVKNNHSCVRLYDQESCTGNYIELLPYAIYQTKLDEWEFNDKAISAGPCGNPCDIDVTGQLPESGINLTVYELPFYRGSMAYINVNGCTKIPRKLGKRLGTIDLTFQKDQCFELYNNPECITEGNGWSNFQHGSIELRKASPSHNDIRKWIEKIQMVSAISHCSYKCNKNDESQRALAKTEPNLQNPVILYDEVNFTGNGLQIRHPGFHQCISLDQFDEWEGNVRSVKLYEGNETCIVLYDDLDCAPGRWRRRIYHSEAELGTRKDCSTIIPGMFLLCHVARSISFCDPKY